MSRFTQSAIPSRLLACAVTALLACGGEVSGSSTPADGGAPTDDGSAAQRDATTMPSISPCPAATPTHGTPCPLAIDGLTCEYGGTGPHLLCSTLAICVSSDVGSPEWYVTPPSSDCATNAAENPVGCPSTFGTLPTGARCPSETARRCAYDEGICACASCVGDDGSVGATWECIAFPEPPGCPASRPPLGSPCTTRDLTCYYGESCTDLDQPDLACGGYWSLAPGHPCAVRRCQ